MQKKAVKKPKERQTESILDRYESNRDEIIRLAREISDLKYKMIKLLLQDDELFNQIREAHDNEVIR